jgi:hypothetical protein
MANHSSRRHHRRRYRTTIAIVGVMTGRLRGEPNNAQAPAARPDDRYLPNFPFVIAAQQKSQGSLLQAALHAKYNYWTRKECHCTN